MRIAQISPLAESVPPRFYGGTERIVSHLTEELVRQGHEVTLFASADSVTSAELVPCAPEALRLSDVYDPLPYEVLQLETLRQRAADFDILHFHLHHLHLPLARTLAPRAVTTLHGRLDRKEYRPLFAEFSDAPMISISNSQREPVKANWAATIHHGLPESLYPFTEESGQPYLAFLGRIARDKRPDRAIEIARQAGLPLKIAAKIRPADQDYFDTVVRPLLDGSDVEFIGEIGEDEKAAFLGGARALLFPIDWPEPFGLVMIEAMACGTPVIAWRKGSVPEVVDDGVSGRVVSSLDEAVAAVRGIGALDRARVRRQFKARFTAERMARDHLQLYRSMARPGRDARNAA